MSDLGQFVPGIEFIRPRITRDVEMEREFIQAIQEKMREEDAKRLEKIHVSDLVYCLRKAYYRRNGVEKRENRMSVMIKSIGKAHHVIFEVFRDAVKEMEVERYGVVGTIDMYRDGIIELKTTRREVSPDEISPAYMRQIAYYIILTGARPPEAKLIIINIQNGKLRVYTLNYERPLKWYREEFFDRLKKLKHALKTGDDSVLRNTKFPWECRFCEYAHACPEVKTGG